MTSQATAIRQAEFLQKLSALMNEYDVTFSAESESFGFHSTREYIAIDACGSWIPWHQRVTYFDVDRCIEATQETIKFAEALTP